MTASTIRATPVGGVGEIGKNHYLIEHDGRIVVIDCGVKFPTHDQLGVDLVLPDFEVLQGRYDAIEALVLTHGHEDHIGAVPYFIKTVGRVPILGTKFTLALVKSKLDEHRLGDVELIEIAPGERRNLGPFEAEFIRVAHSILTASPSPCDPGRQRAPHRDFCSTRHRSTTSPPTWPRCRAGRQDLLLLSDSTNAGGPGPSHLSAGRPELRRQLAQAPGRVITGCSSHIHRCSRSRRRAPRRQVPRWRTFAPAELQHAVGLGIVRVPATSSTRASQPP